MIAATAAADAVFADLLGRYVYLRPGTTDHRVFTDTFRGLYHVPPDTGFHPATVLDVGANIGLVSAHYAYLWPTATVVAAEMDDGNAARIDLNAPYVRVIECAVAAERGWTRYNPGRAEDSYRIGRTGRRVVRTITMRSAIVRAFGMSQPVDLLKLDVEGAEWEILEHAEWWAPRVRRMYVEFHGRGTSDRILRRGRAAVERAGFRLLPEQGTHPAGVWAERP